MIAVQSPEFCHEFWTMDCHLEEHYSDRYAAATGPRLRRPPENARSVAAHRFSRASETALRALFSNGAPGCGGLCQLSMAPKLLNFGEDVCGFAFRSIGKQILARVSNFWYLLPNKRE